MVYQSTKNSTNMYNFGHGFLKLDVSVTVLVPEAHLKTHAIGFSFGFVPAWENM